MTSRRTTLIVGAIAIGVAIAALVLESGGGSATASGPASPTATAAVIRTTLASRQEVPGTLERAGSYTLVVQRPTGTITWLPGPGAVIRRDQVLYRIDGQPVRLLFGAQAAWRRLARRVPDGADVRQLKRSLIALGFTANGALTVDDHFDWETAVAIKQWQRANGVAQTGVVPLGSVAFLPGAVRVTAQRALPGTPAQPGTPVLDLSSTDLVVNVPLDPSLRQLVHVGDRVQIQLPEGQTTAGRVSQIAAATAATGASPDSSTPAGAGASGQGAGGSSSQGNAGPSATVPVTISLERPGAARGLDQVPVQVGITDTVRHHVLAVPIAALLALAQGGYAVAVEDHGTRTLIAVTPGVFDGGRVQVTSSQLRPGMRVEVPSS
jgi:peptidoglycan hydrolase-like protein with peptidoglycan-binding domain